MSESACKHLCGCETDGNCCDTQYVSGGYLPLSPVCASTIDQNLIEIAKLWYAEYCEHEIKFFDDTPTVILTWHDDRNSIHGEDWTTYDWHFYADTIGEAVSDAVQWCRDLAVWKPCDECDGRGSRHMGDGTSTECGHCEGSGLANRMEQDT